MVKLPCGCVFHRGPRLDRCLEDAEWVEACEAFQAIYERSLSDRTWGQALRDAYEHLGEWWPLYEGEAA